MNKIISKILSSLLHFFLLITEIPGSEWCTKKKDLLRWQFWRSKSKGLCLVRTSLLLGTLQNLGTTWQENVPKCVTFPLLINPPGFNHGSPTLINSSNLNLLPEVPPFNTVIRLHSYLSVPSQPNFNMNCGVNTFKPQHYLELDFMFYNGMASPRTDCMCVQEMCSQWSFF